MPLFERRNYDPARPYGYLSDIANAVSEAGANLGREPVVNAVGNAAIYGAGVVGRVAGVPGDIIRDLNQPAPVVPPSPPRLERPTLAQERIRRGYEGLLAPYIEAADRADAERAARNAAQAAQQSQQRIAGWRQQEAEQGAIHSEFMHAFPDTAFSDSEPFHSYAGWRRRGSRMDDPALIQARRINAEAGRNAAYHTAQQQAFGNMTAPPPWEPPAPGPILGGAGPPPQAAPFVDPAHAAWVGRQQEPSTTSAYMATIQEQMQEMARRPEVRLGDWDRHVADMDNHYRSLSAARMPGGAMYPSPDSSPLEHEQAAIAAAFHASLGQQVQAWSQPTAARLQSREAAGPEGGVGEVLPQSR